MDKYKSAIEYVELVDLKVDVIGHMRSFCRLLIEWIDAKAYLRHYDAGRDVWYECKDFDEFMTVIPKRGLGVDKDEMIANLEFLARVGMEEAQSVLDN